MAHRGNSDDKKQTDAMPQVFGDPRTVEITEANPNYKCVFCHRHELNPTEWGVLLKLDDIVTHHFCLLFSALVEQRGRDNEGIQAFLPVDIRREVRRGKRLKCKFCKNNNATIGCGIAKCNISFHYTCGYENGCLSQFFGQYQSYCFKHKPKQQIPMKTSVECPICMVDTDTDDAIWPPCCGKQLFHRRCIMFTAKAAGYFFKCPLCNSSTPTFIQAMKANGVYIPEQDAAWELEPHAYEELMSHYSRCDAKLCLCPDGREFATKNGSKNWQIIRCNCCASSATHMKCSDLKIYQWKCGDCKSIFRKSGVKDPDDPGLSSSPENSDAESNTSDSSDESSSEEEILPHLPEISNVVNFHRLSDEELSKLPLLSSHKQKFSNPHTPDAMEASGVESALPNENSATGMNFSGSSTRAFPNRNVNRNPSVTPAIFLQKLEQLRISAVMSYDKEQSAAEKEVERKRDTTLQAFLHSKSLERKEERYNARSLQNGNHDLERTQQIPNGADHSEVENFDSSSKSHVTQDGITNSDLDAVTTSNETPETGTGTDSTLKQVRIRKFFNCIPHQVFSVEEKTEEQGGVKDFNSDDAQVGRTVKRLAPGDFRDHYRKISELQESLYKLANGAKLADSNES